MTHLEQSTRQLSEPAEGWLAMTDQTRQFYRHWRGNCGAPVVVYLHGIEGHGEWFVDTACRLNESGFSVYAFDRRGAGRSEGPRGDLRDFRLLLGDIDEMLARARQDNPGSPIVLMANCWGAKAAIAVAARNAPAALVLTSPAVAVKVDVSITEKLNIALSWLTRQARLFEIPLSPEMFTDKEPYLGFIRHDPLRLTHATAAFFVQSVLLTWVSWREAGRLQCPLFVLQAGSDAIVDVEGVSKWVDKAGSKDKTMRVFDQAAHSLDFDTCAPDYARDVIEWVESRTGDGKK